MIFPRSVNKRLLTLWLLPLLTGQSGYTLAACTPVSAAPRARPGARGHLSPHTRPAGQEARPLARGQHVTREIAGGEKHAYRISLAAGEHARVVVEQRGIDLALSTFTPDGRKLLDLNGPPGPAGAEAVSIPA